MTLGDPALTAAAMASIARRARRAAVGASLRLGRRRRGGDARDRLRPAAEPPPAPPGRRRRRARPLRARRAPGCTVERPDRQAGEHGGDQARDRRRPADLQLGPVHGPGHQEAVHREVRGRGQRGQLRQPRGDGHQAAGRRPLRPDLADAPSTSTGSTRRGCCHRFDRDSLNNADGISSFYDSPGGTPNNELSVPYTYYTTGIAWRERRRQRDDRLLERPHQPRRRREDVHPRRLPGGDRRGEPDQRLRPQHRRPERARDLEADAARAEGVRARDLDQLDPEPGQRARRSSTRPGTATSSTSATRSTTPRTSATRPARRACPSAPT